MSSASQQSVKRLKPLDAAFLALETRDTPMHVAALQIFSLHDQVHDEFVKNVVQRYRQPSAVDAPWNLRLVRVPFGRVVPAFKVTTNIDFEYHVRHSSLPRPGGERELGELISHLHGTPLDRSRPLWTCHIIEGLSGGRFAIYLKIHHAIADGVQGMRMIARALESNPGHHFRPPWESVPKSDTGVLHQKKSRAALTPPPVAVLHELARALRPALLKRRDEAELVLPFESPKSKLNGLVTNARRVSTQSLPIVRIKRIGDTAGVSINDVFLSLCSTALRRHLQSLGSLPKQSLTAAVPVSLREDGDSKSANAIGFVWSSLATDRDDPLSRLQAIARSMRASKAYLKSMPSSMRLPVTSMLAVPGTVLGMLGIAHRMKPAMNVVISNVPGPGKTLYLGSARLDAIYPVSIPSQGQALNITCVSYAGRLNIGFTGSRDALPSLQKLSVYTADALYELEQSLELPDDAITTE